MNGKAEHRWDRATLGLAWFLSPLSWFLWFWLCVQGRGPEGRFMTLQLKPRARGEQRKEKARGFAHQAAPRAAEVRVP